MNPDNFLVRPHRRWVERYREADAWSALDLEQATRSPRTSPTCRALCATTTRIAKRFDLIMLRLQLCRLRDEPGQERLRHQVQEIAAGLLEQTGDPRDPRATGDCSTSLPEMSGGSTSPRRCLERARRRMRGLVRLLDKRKRVFVYTDFDDELGEIAEVELRGSPRAPTSSASAKRRGCICASMRTTSRFRSFAVTCSSPGTTSTELERMLAEAGIGDVPDD